MLVTGAGRALRANVSFTVRNYFPLSILVLLTEKGLIYWGLSVRIKF